MGYERRRAVEPQRCDLLSQFEPVSVGLDVLEVRGDGLLDVASGPLYFRRLVTNESVSSDYIDALVAAIVRSCRVT